MHRLLASVTCGTRQYVLDAPRSYCPQLYRSLVAGVTPVTNQYIFGATHAVLSQQLCDNLLAESTWEHAGTCLDRPGSTAVLPIAVPLPCWRDSSFRQTRRCEGGPWRPRRLHRTVRRYVCSTPDMRDVQYGNRAVQHVGSVVYQPRCAMPSPGLLSLVHRCAACALGQRCTVWDGMGACA